MLNPKITVLRTGHRAQRDIRVTTHCGLVARAFGSTEFIICGEPATNTIKSIQKVATKWGGRFIARQGLAPIQEIKKWKNKTHGQVVHLTMYGTPLETHLHRLRKEKNVLIIVGAEKVPIQIYAHADYNISIGLQPHSEIAALAILLHEIHEGKELGKHFSKAKIKIIPQSRGKNVQNQLK